MPGVTVVEMVGVGSAQVMVRHGLTMAGFAGSNAWNDATNAVKDCAGALSGTRLMRSPVQAPPCHTLMDMPGGFVVNPTFVPRATLFDTGSWSSRRSIVPGISVGAAVTHVTVRQGLGSIRSSGNDARIEIEVGEFMTNGNAGIVMLAYGSPSHEVPYQ